MGHVKLVKIDKAKVIDPLQVSITEERFTGTCDRCQRTYRLRRLSIEIEGYLPGKTSAVCDLCSEEYPVQAVLNGKKSRG